MTELSRRDQFLCAYIQGTLARRAWDETHDPLLAVTFMDQVIAEADKTLPQPEPVKQGWVQATEIFRGPDDKLGRYLVTNSSGEYWIATWDGRYWYVQRGSYLFVTHWQPITGPEEAKEQGK